MKRFFAAAIIFLCLGMPMEGFGQIPKLVSYQGLLADSTGVFKPDGTYSVTFRLYVSASGGSALWTETKSLPVTGGLFSTILGDATSLIGLTFDRQYWLSIQVGAEAEITTRLQFTTVPYSIMSIKSDTASYAVLADTAAFVRNLPATDSARIAGTVPDNAISSAKILDKTILRADVDPRFKAPLSDTADYVRLLPAIDSTRIAGTVPDGSLDNIKIKDSTFTSSKVAMGELVRSLNGMRDGITLSAQGGATISSNQDTIFINAGSGGGGTGIQGVQNTNNTLDILNPNGPSATINVKALGITGAFIGNGAVDGTKLTANSVATPHIANGAVTQLKIAPGVTFPPSGAASGDLTGIYPNPSVGANVITTANIVDGSLVLADLKPGFKAPFADTADFARAALPGGTAGGDLSGIYPNPTINANVIMSANILNGTIQSVDVQNNFRAPLADTADYVRNLPSFTDSARIAGTVPNNSIGNSKIQDNSIAKVKLAFVPGTIDGSGLPGQVAFWSGGSSITGNNSLFWDDSTKRLGIGTPSPLFHLDISGPSSQTLRLSTTSANTPVRLTGGGTGSAGFLIAGAGTNPIALATTGLERMRIEANGFVGVGTSAPKSVLEVGGGIASAIIRPAADITLDETHSVILCSSALTITLPPAATAVGRQYTVKNLPGGPGGDVTLLPVTNETIEGGPNFLIPTGTAYTMVSDGTSWWFIGKY